MCWNKALIGVDSIKLSFVPLCSRNTCKDVFNQMLLYTFQSNCAEGLHFSAFHI